MIASSIESRFNECSRSIKAIAETVKATVFGFCEQNGFAYTGRIKSLESLSEKLETGRFARWSELDDLFGCTVVIPRLTDEAQVVDFLQRAFETVAIKRRSTTSKAPEVFRFEATRFIGRLREAPEIVDYVDTCFEVQVRTAFEHAWSVTTHALVYKSNSVDWRRLRLAAQLKAAVEQLDLLVVGFDAASERVLAHDWPDVTLRAEVTAEFETLFASNVLPPEVRPKDLSRFADNIVSALNVKRNDAAAWSAALAKLTARLRSIEAAKVPRSISLFQFVLAEAASLNLIARNPKRTFPITREVLNLYPHLTGWPVFELAG